MSTLIISLEENARSAIIHQRLLKHLTQRYLARSEMMACWHNNLDFGPARHCIFTDLLCFGFIA